VFVLDRAQDRHELVRQSLTVGVEHLAGELAGGYETWAAAGLPAAAIELLGPAAVDGATVLDVRQHGEFVSGHVPSARNVELGALPGGGDLPGGPLTVMCGHGERAMTGASVLERAGHHDLAVVIGGPDDWAATSGRPLATGP
jgi:rhodanese-related sulfurtransferase